MFALGSFVHCEWLLTPTRRGTPSRFTVLAIARNRDRLVLVHTYAPVQEHTIFSRVACRFPPRVAAGVRTATYASIPSIRLPKSTGCHARRYCPGGGPARTGQPTRKGRDESLGQRPPQYPVGGGSFTHIAYVRTRQLSFYRLPSSTANRPDPSPLWLPACLAVVLAFAEDVVVIIPPCAASISIKGISEPLWSSTLFSAPSRQDAGSTPVISSLGDPACGADLPQALSESVDNSRFRYVRSPLFILSSNGPVRSTRTSPVNLNQPCFQWKRTSSTLCTL